VLRRGGSAAVEISPSTKASAVVYDAVYERRRQRDYLAIEDDELNEDSDSDSDSDSTVRSTHWIHCEARQLRGPIRPRHTGQEDGPRT